MMTYGICLTKYLVKWNVVKPTTEHSLQFAGTLARVIGGVGLCQRSCVRHCGRLQDTMLMTCIVFCVTPHMISSWVACIITCRTTCMPLMGCFIWYYVGVSPTIAFNATTCGIHAWHIGINRQPSPLTTHTIIHRERHYRCLENKQRKNQILCII